MRQLMTLNAGASEFVREFIHREGLAALFSETVSRYYGFAAQRIRALIRQSQQVPIVGINGAQGTGKSTFAACVAGLLAHQGVRALVLSIDDLYYPLAIREELGRNVHPLLRTRGVPGTHDMALGLRIFEFARNHHDSGSSLIVPHFDKGADDRDGEGTPFPEEGVDVVLFEGWCVGAKPQPCEALEPACNDLERHHDAGGHWRTHVNRALSSEYAEVFSRLDYLIMLKPPDFDAVYRWRGEQEEKLRLRLEREGRTDARAMNDEELTFFISHYERLTRWMFDEMPERADEVFFIGEDHQVSAHRSNGVRTTQTMISTDLDATLLNDEYQWAPAKPALQRLAGRGAYVVLNSSKTFSEMRLLAETLISECGVRRAPIVAENGAVLALPDDAADGGYRLTHTGIRRERIVAFARRLREEFSYRFEGFADMQPDDVVAHTGLTLDAARLAMDRKGTEPIFWRDSDEAWQAFEQALVGEGIRAVRGGRFIHLMGAKDKVVGQEEALRWCQERDFRSLWRVIALGDSPNDKGMLDAADIAVVIQNPHARAGLAPSALYNVFPSHFGPVAWNTAILSILEQGINH
jgi:D-glycerate 3-kinase